MTPSARSIRSKNSYDAAGRKAANRAAESRRRPCPGVPDHLRTMTHTTLQLGRSRRLARRRVRPQCNLVEICHRIIAKIGDIAQFRRSARCPPIGIANRPTSKQRAWRGRGCTCPADGNTEIRRKTHCGGRCLSRRGPCMAEPAIMDERGFSSRPNSTTVPRPLRARVESAARFFGAIGPGREEITPASRLGADPASLALE